MIKILEGANGSIFKLNVPPTDKSYSICAISPHKCGSMLLQNIMSDLCAVSDFPFLNIYSEFFSTGHNHWDFRESIETVISGIGYCYGVLRVPWTRNLDTVAGHKKIFLVRDPRDVIVSLYFSLTRSHALPGQGSSRDSLLSRRTESLALSIDEFVQQGKEFGILENMRTFMQWSETLPNSRLFKYEDIIFEKKRWIAEMVGFLDLNVSADTIKAIADRHNIIPKDEDPDRHIRQVTPGNHKKHLSRQSIAVIETAFGDILEKMSY